MQCLIGFGNKYGSINLFGVRDISDISSIYSIFIIRSLIIIIPYTFQIWRGKRIIDLGINGKRT